MSQWPLWAFGMAGVLRGDLRWGRRKLGALARTPTLFPRLSRLMFSISAISNIIFPRSFCLGGIFFRIFSALLVTGTAVYIQRLFCVENVPWYIPTRFSRNARAWRYKHRPHAITTAERNTIVHGQLVDPITVIPLYMLSYYLMMLL